MTNDEYIESEISRLPWYHTFKLDGRTITGWEAIAPLWDMIRSVRKDINYQGKRVLDIGSRDGMWAFEAEKLGASTVVATDVCGSPYYNHALLMRFLLRSDVWVFYNVSVERLCEGLTYFLEWNPGKFDIIQHLGVFYHLENPLSSLAQCRNAIKDGGFLLLETAIFTDDNKAPVARFNSDSGVYADKHTFWAFNESALLASLEMYRFQVCSITRIKQTPTISRACIVATAI